MTTAAQTEKERLTNGAPAATNDAAEPTREPARMEVVKASFNLPKRELDALKGIAAIRGVSATQALRQAIAILAFLVELPKGSRLFVREPSGDQREVVFHQF